MRNQNEQLKQDLAEYDQTFDKMTEELQLRKEKIDFLTLENRKLNIAKLTAEGALTRLENRPKYSLGS